MDILTNRKVRSFAKANGYTAGNDGDLFERYVAYYYLAGFIGNDLSLIDDVVVAGGDDGGIDIAAVIVNGAIVSDPSDVVPALNDGNSNSVEIVLIQAKTAEKYDTKLISKFLHAVEHLTRTAAGESVTTLAAGLRQTAAVIGQVLDNFTAFNSNRLPCTLVYVTTAPNSGVVGGAGHEQMLEHLRRIREIGIYQSDLTCELHGKEDVERKEVERNGPRDVIFQFPKRVVIPAADGIEQAYIGVISGLELLSLLRDDQGLRPGIFTDNVRLYQGDHNEVNREIFSTLTSDSPGVFPFLNNGLTIVARELASVADRFTASGYQIVNGGQTSHQVIRWKEWLDARYTPSEADRRLEQLWVPMKLIGTNGAEMVTRVTVATNSQSAIGPAEIQGSTADAKHVEQYFLESGVDGLRYARQSGIDLGSLGVPRLRVVTTPELDRAVSACVFGESARSIGSPLELYSGDSYVWGGNPVTLYFFAAWIVYRIDSYFRRVNRDEVVALKAAKYHIAMLVAGSVLPELLPVFLDQRDPRDRDLKEAAKALQENKSWQDFVDGKIDLAVNVVADYFADILAIPRALRKDDVRARKVEVDLYNKLFSDD